MDQGRMYSLLWCGSCKLADPSSSLGRFARSLGRVTQGEEKRVLIMEYVSLMSSMQRYAGQTQNGSRRCRTTTGSRTTRDSRFAIEGLVVNCVDLEKM